jgi:diadenosine tetraphosphatase ApaH/serine/threonine PP2A family protein phosphatase
MTEFRLIEINTAIAHRRAQRPRIRLMRVAIFADIHSNRPAFGACLARARAQGAERFVLLGDYVGYGADPDWTVSTVMELVDQGAIAVLGNHDHAVGDLSERLNVEAQIAMEWTRGQLGTNQRQFLGRLPLTIAEGESLFVHADASHPAQWKYVANVEDAAESFDAVGERLIFCGHIHLPALYSMSATGKLTSFVPTTDVAVPLLRGRRWLAVLGSVGQPRDGNPAAAYAMLDTEKGEITYCRAPYDIEQAADSIRKAGLPPRLADRLFRGR